LCADGRRVLKPTAAQIVGSSLSIVIGSGTSQKLRGEGGWCECIQKVTGSEKSVVKVLEGQSDVHECLEGGCALRWAFRPEHRPAGAESLTSSRRRSSPPPVHL
jgi:hypothetical protein